MITVKLVGVACLIIAAFIFLRSDGWPMGDLIFTGVMTLLGVMLLCWRKPNRWHGPARPKIDFVGGGRATK